jgi:hypothetical protein
MKVVVVEIYTHKTPVEYEVKYCSSKHIASFSNQITWDSFLRDDWYDELVMRKII